MGPWPTSPSDFHSKTTESCAYLLVPPSNHSEICSFLIFWLEIWCHYLGKCIWKFEVSKNQHGSHDTFFLVLHNHIQWNLSHSRFQTFRVRLWCILKNVMSLQWGFPKMGESLQFHSGTCILTPYLELTIPVLLKTSFKYRFHPLAPLTPPPYLILLAPPFLPPPPCPFPQPLLPTIWPPRQK